MYSVFSAAVASITPAITSVNAEIIAVVPKEIGHTSKKHLGNRDDGSNYYGYRETPPPGYYGNWGYAPGGYYWDPNYQWRRSLGFWDTNSPACPFRSCQRCYEHAQVLEFVLRQRTGSLFYKPATKKPDDTEADITKHK
jgi:hypothetical protein